MNSSLSTTTSFFKMKKLMTTSGFHDDHFELLKIKSEWRSMQHNEIFQDYLFLREIQAKKQLVPFKEVPRISTLLPFLQLQQKRKLDRLQRHSKLKSISQLADNTPQGSSINNAQLDEIVQIITEIISKLLIEQLEKIQPLLEQLVKTCKACGSVSFYFIAIFLQTQVQFVYCRRKEGYNIWKRFLRTCNLQGQSLQKYKLLAYRQLAKCCLDLRDYEKEAVYLKKLIKLSWVTKNRNYELLGYDMIAINFYYQGDIERAQFFHQKFVAGEYESEDSNIRRAGIGEYLTKQRQKAEINDQDSFSVDDMDFDIIIQKDNIAKWQKGLPVFDKKNTSPHRVFINQWSCNRDLTVHLINREKSKLPLQDDEIGFVPLNGNIKKLMKLFLFDVKYYMKNGNLFNFDLQ